MLGRRDTAARRRSGPAGEDRWWDPADQAVAESRLLRPADLGRGWSRAAMVNNAERLDPFGDDEASAVVREVVGRRRRTALHEGEAWRRRRDGVLCVLRVEVFDAGSDGGGPDAGAAAHRRSWEEHGTASLDATWRQRWRERDREPGWIEARRRPVGDGADEVATPEDVTWLVVEDQTGVHDGGAVTIYEHLTIWAGRAVATLTLRHDLGVEVDDVAASAAQVVDRALRAALG